MVKVVAAALLHADKVKLIGEKSRRGKFGLIIISRRQQHTLPRMVNKMEEGEILSLGSSGIKFYSLTFIPCDGSPPPASTIYWL